MGDQTLSDAAVILWYVAISLSELLPFLMLFGFFESRKSGDYRFRSRRFLVFVLCLIALNLSVSIVTDYGLANLTIDASKVAERAVLSNRVVAEYRIRNETVIFPEALDDKKISCFRAALSNYIEDQWNGYVHDETCKGAQHICANNETDYYNALLRQYDQQNIANDYNAMGAVLNSIWSTAAEMYKLTRRLHHLPDSDGHMLDPPDEQMLASYRHYLDTCASLKPLSWVTPGEELLVVHPHLCFWGCS